MIKSPKNLININIFLSKFSGHINYFCNFISFNKHESCNWKVMLLILKINFVNNFIHPSTGHLLFFFLKFVHIQCFSLFFFSLNFIFTSKFRRKQEVRGTPCFLPFWSSYISSVLSFLLCLSQFHRWKQARAKLASTPSMALSPTFCLLSLTQF